MSTANLPYSVAVIIAGYLPIYALTGPSAKLFAAMADTVSIALVGDSPDAYTFVPVIALWFKRGVLTMNKPFKVARDKYAGRLEWCLNHQKITLSVRVDLRTHAAAHPAHQEASSYLSRRKIACMSARNHAYRFV